MFKINNTFLRGLTAQIKRQLLSITRHSILNILLPVFLILTAGFIAAGFDFDILFAITVAVLGTVFIPFFSRQTISKERALGMHFLSIECGHRRGVMILGSFIADALIWLLICFTGVIAHVYTMTVALGTPLSIGFYGRMTLFCIACCAMISAVNVCVSAYSMRRRLSCVFSFFTMLMSGAAYFFIGSDFVLGGYIYSILLMTSVVFLLILAYFSYRLRARIMS